MKIKKIKIILFFLILFALCSNSFAVFVKEGYNLEKIKIKGFYESIGVNTTLNKITKEVNKLKKENGLFLFYLILGFLETESGITNYGTNHSYKVKNFYNLYICNNFFVKNYKGKPSRSKYGHNISICKILNYMKERGLTNKERKLFLNYKTSYAGAIGIFQMMPNNIWYYLKTGIFQYKKGDLLKFTYYFNSLKNFITEKDQNNYNYLKYNYNINDLKLCRKGYINKKCTYLRKIIFRYNHSENYVNKVLTNAYYLYLSNKVIDLYGNPILNVNYLRLQFNNKLHFGPYDIVTIKQYSNLIKKESIFNKFFLINPINNIANCYYFNYLEKKYRNNIICISNYSLMGYYGNIDYKKTLKIFKKKGIKYKLNNNLYKIYKKIYGKNIGKDKLEVYKIYNLKPGKIIGIINNKINFIYKIRNNKLNNNNYIKRYIRYILYNNPIFKGK